jgi:hypothetical protein
VDGLVSGAFEFFLYRNVGSLIEFISAPFSLLHCSNDAVYMNINYNHDSSHWGMKRNIGYIVILFTILVATFRTVTKAIALFFFFRTGESPTPLKSHCSVKCHLVFLLRSLDEQLINMEMNFDYHSP